MPEVAVMSVNVTEPWANTTPVGAARHMVKLSSIQMGLFGWRRFIFDMSFQKSLVENQKKKIE